LQCSDIVKEPKKVKLIIVFPKFFLLVIQFRIWVIIRAEFIFRCSEVQQSSQAVQKKTSSLPQEEAKRETSPLAIQISKSKKLSNYLNSLTICNLLL
jgi:hypothetical protein